MSGRRGVRIDQIRMILLIPRVELKNQVAVRTDALVQVAMRVFGERVGRQQLRVPAATRPHIAHRDEWLSLDDCFPHGGVHGSLQLLFSGASPVPESITEYALTWLRAYSSELAFTSSLTDRLDIAARFWRRPKPNRRLISPGTLAFLYRVELGERTGLVCPPIRTAVGKPTVGLVATEAAELDFGETSARARDRRMEFAEVLVGGDQDHQIARLPQDSIRHIEQARQPLTDHRL